MQHFPIFVNTVGLRVALVGGGDAALAKLRLLLKTEANIDVFAPHVSEEILKLVGRDKVTLIERSVAADDLEGFGLVYCATENAAEDGRVAKLARAFGISVNIVDNLQDSDFITPAIVDRDPVTANWAHSPRLLAEVLF